MSTPHIAAAATKARAALAAGASDPSLPPRIRDWLTKLDAERAPISAGADVGLVDDLNRADIAAHLALDVYKMAPTATRSDDPVQEAVTECRRLVLQLSWDNSKS